MPAKKSFSKTALSQEQINTYFHRRLARLERNNGQQVHPHPTERSLEDEKEETRVAAEVAARAKARKDEEKARIAKEAKKRAEHTEADSDAPLTPGDGEIIPGSGE